MRSFPAIALLLLSAAQVVVQARDPVRARHAMVVSREPHATDAGVQALRTGGNAVDAAVAVGFALAVTHPAAGNIGGGGFMLIRFADGRTAFLDFRERAPGAASRNMYLDATGKATEDSVVGWRAPGVPGTVRGLELAWKKYGRKRWEELVAPAVKLASGGFPVSYGLARSLKATKVLARFPESKRIFLKEGAWFEAGDTLRQPELGATLDRIARFGAKDFYEGETARMFAQQMREHGGLIALADLKEYEVVERKPLTGSYRGHDIVTAPPPSSGGIGILQMMGVLEGTGYEKHGFGAAASIHSVAEAMRRYFADRAKYLGDPDFVQVPVAGLLDREYIARLRQSIDPDRATPSADIRNGELPAHESAETTHYSIVDAEGNAVAVTYTLNGSYGSGVTVPGLGILLNNEMDDFAAKPGSPNMFGLVQGEANAIAPRKRPLSSMTPAIITRDGRLSMVVGAPGGPTIMTAVLQTILNVVDFGMNIRDAIEAPRVHHQWLPDVLRVEPGISPDTLKLLEARGHKIEKVRAMAEVEAIQVEPGWLAGAADPRSEGNAAGY